MKKFEFVEQLKALHPTTRLCRVRGVSPSGYWAWKKRVSSARATATAQLQERIVAVHTASRAPYGAPRIHAELRAQGVCCSRKRVARLMREQGLFAQRPRHRTVTTQSKPGAQVAPNLLQRDFSANEPNTKWTSPVFVESRKKSMIHLMWNVGIIRSDNVWPTLFARRFPSPKPW